VAGGTIERRSAADDRRRVELCLTAAGEKHLERLQRFAGEQHAAAFAVLGDLQRAAVVRLHAQRQRLYPAQDEEAVKGRLTGPQGILQESQTLG